MKSCTVNIITKTSKSLSLTYYFDGVAQSSNSKTFDSSYNKVLKVKVIAASSEVLELVHRDSQITGAIQNWMA
ncbi:hypothetical protein TVAG_257670 [Trichomonas vaginalis G3]|uniref:Uncharacterized protein n=1 Tax=Trichomonas vaginalis (strain ATCC PRA-98 / G3) TaxID=412133 RepID=A2F4E8_TRIV3|nr:alpha-amylase family [Trichomonas vaginalis G3]EAY00213.1 hypothetical protein TVAG_257670 [Trichomonas vaginalis G3]KAI5492897.1 alpha-amylase family [Trichomonas vaginalis G3]|eukprot:XP_001313142.1 hypothetical protein [Trichomonas vaginalis G3]